jgi:DNA-binding IclR family transcriptional regulator
VILNSSRTSKEIIEQGLGTLGKIKILKSLAEDSRMLTVYVLHNKTRLKREDIKRNLNDLIEIRWVKETKMANKMYTLDLHNEYVTQLVSFFRSVGYIE